MVLQGAELLKIGCVNDVANHKRRCISATVTYRRAVSAKTSRLTAASFFVYKAAVTADVGRSQKEAFVPRASENDRRPQPLAWSQ